MKRYVIRRTNAAVPLIGEVQGTIWEAADVLDIDCYPWFTAGRKQPTTVRVLYDDQTLYVQFDCRDKHIFSRTTELNGPVCKDSCVEFFAAPRGGEPPAYFNLEINCCGTPHLGFGAGRGRRTHISPEAAKRLGVVTSVPSPTKDESPDDRSWWVAVRLPFELLDQLPGGCPRPKAGEAWRANFYRCGGKTDPQYACWNPIDTAKQTRPNFHDPGFFGEMIFG